MKPNLWILGAFLGHFLVFVRGEDDAESLGTAEFEQSLWMGTIILTSGLLVFEILRSWKHSQIVFQPNAFVPDKTLHGYDMPPKLPVGFFRWIPQIYRLSEEEVTDYTTLDDSVLLRFLQLCVRFFIFASVFGLAMILPINASRNSLTDDDTSSDLDKFTVSNVEDSSDFFWAHAVYLWILSIVIMALLWGEYSYYVELRKSWFQEGGTARCQHHAVLVTDIPAQRIIASKDGGDEYSMAFKILMSSYNLILDAVRIGSLGLVDLRKIQLFVRNRYADIVRKRREWRSSRESEITKKATEARKMRELRRTSYITPDQIASLDSMINDMKGVHYDVESAELVSNHGKGVENAQFTGLHKSVNPVLTSVDDDKGSDSSKIPDHVPDEEIEGYLRAHSQRKVLKEKLREHFEACFPGDYNGCSLVVDTTKLDIAVNKFKAKEDALRRQEASLMFKKKEGQNVEKDMNKLVELIKEHAEAEKLVETSKQDLDRQDPPFAAIVTFLSRRSATIAAQVVHSAENRWTVQAAPPPSDIFWANLSFTRQTRILRQTRSTVMAVLIVIFFIPPITLLQNSLDPENIDDSALSFLVDNGFLRRFVVGFLPQLITIIFLVIGHVASRWVASLGGATTYSSRDRRALVTYYNVLLFNVFIIKLISGDLLETIVDWLEDPSNVDNQPGGALSKQATFFAIFVVLRLCISMPFELIHFGWIIKYPLKIGWKKIFHETVTESEKRDAIVPEAVPYHRVIPQQMLVFIIGLTYAPIAPLILPISAAYFIAAFFVWKYNTVYVYRQSYRSGGFLWPLIFRLIIASFIVSHVITLSLLYVRRAFGPATFLVPLPFILILFSRRCESEFVEPTTYLPLDVASNLNCTRQEDEANEPKSPGVAQGRARLSRGEFICEIDVHDVYHPPNLLADFSSSFRRASQYKSSKKGPCVNSNEENELLSSPVIRRTRTNNRQVSSSEAAPNSSLNVQRSTSNQNISGRDFKVKHVGFDHLERSGSIYHSDHETSNEFYDAVDDIQPTVKDTTL